MSIEAMKQAWEAEQKANPHTAYNSWCRGYEAALRTAIEQAEKQEPYRVEQDLYGEEIKLYTTPPAAQRQWVGLTDEQIKHAPHHMVDGAYHYSFKQGAEWADRWLRELNGGQA